MTRLAVTDANIFIDLIILGLVEHLFELDIDIHTTREVFDQLTVAQKEVLNGHAERGVLFIYSFSSDELGEISELDFPAGLEPADRSVFYYVVRLNCLVISGDNKLRKFCEREGLEVHGLIWIFDQLVELELVSKKAAIEKLNRLISYNDRLPMDEIVRRIRKWK